MEKKLKIIFERALAFELWNHKTSQLAQMNFGLLQLMLVPCTMHHMQIWNNHKMCLFAHCASAFYSAWSANGATAEYDQMNLWLSSFRVHRIFSKLFCFQAPALSISLAAEEQVLQFNYCRTECLRGNIIVKQADDVLRWVYRKKGTSLHRKFEWNWLSQATTVEEYEDALEKR